MRPGKPELGVHGGDGVPSRDRGADRTWTLTHSPPAPAALSSSFDNSSLCSGGGDKAVVLWDVASGQVVRKFRGHAGVSSSKKWGREGARGAEGPGSAFLGS